MKDITGREIRATQMVELLEFPYGKWEVDAVDERNVYPVSGPGTILCAGHQVRIVDK